jgi:cell division transport system permease protein
MYSLKIAIKSILREKWINFLTAFTIGLALLMFSGTVFVVYNVESISGRLPEKFTIMAYLKDGLADADIRKIRVELERERLVKSVTFISKDQAFRELKSSLRGSEYILEGLDENPLSASFEIRIRKDLFSSQAVGDLIKNIEKLPSVDAVDYGKGFLDFVQSFRMALSIVGVFVACLIFFAIGFVIYSTIKILFYRRNDEIETYKLLGATANFIRAPFLIEGGVIGCVGGLFGVLGSYLLYYFIFFRLGRDISLIQYLSFPIELFGFLPLIGAVAGLFGTVAAIGRIKF